MEYPTHRGTPYSPCITLLTVEHPTNRVTPNSLKNTLLTAKHRNHRGTPYSLGNTLLTTEDPTHRGTPYSTWTCPPWNTFLTRKETFKKKLRSMALHTDITPLDCIGRGAESVVYFDKFGYLKPYPGGCLWPFSQLHWDIYFYFLYVGPTF